MGHECIGVIGGGVNSEDSILGSTSRSDVFSSLGTCRALLINLIDLYQVAFLEQKVLYLSDSISLPCRSGSDQSPSNYTGNLRDQ